MSHKTMHILYLFRTAILNKDFIQSLQNDAPVHGAVILFVCNIIYDWAYFWEF